MTPKSLLRHKLAVSTLAEFATGSQFRLVIDEADTIAPDDQVARVVLCSGKVYYDLLAERRERGVNDVALVRMEQIYPFPNRSLPPVLARYPNAEVVWCQEEPRNMGAWSFVDRRIEETLAALPGVAKRPLYIGRCEAASPATGQAKVHLAQQTELVQRALRLA